MLIYALFTGASVTRLFMSGIIPAAFMAGGLILLGAFIAARRGFPTNDRASWGAVPVFYAAFVGSVFYRSIGFGDLWDCVNEAGCAPAGLLVIVVSAGSSV